MRWGTVAASDGAAEHRGAAAHHGGGQIGYWIAWLDLVRRESFFGGLQFRQAAVCFIALQQRDSRLVSSQRRD